MALQISSKTYDQLLRLFRVATLDHQDLVREILLNAMLEKLIGDKKYSDANLLVQNVTMTQPYRSNYQAARYHYYVGRIRAVQLEYVEAAECFAQALRKCHDNAQGFKIIVTKCQVINQLLMGEVPARSLFVQEDTAPLMKPYLELTSAVRFGKLIQYQNVMVKYQQMFEDDGLYTLAHRVHQIVMKTALSRVIKAYAKVSLKDIQAMMAFDGTVDDMQHVISKSIRDGVIEAYIENGVVISAEEPNIYGTSEPAAAFHRRIEFLNKIHNQVTMGMRYLPENESEERVEPVTVDEDELMKALADEEDMI